MRQGDGRWENWRWKMAVCMFVVKIAKSFFSHTSASRRRQLRTDNARARKDRVSVKWHVKLTRIFRAETFGRPAFSFILAVSYIPKQEKNTQLPCHRRNGFLKADAPRWREMHHLKVVCTYSRGTKV